MDTAKISRESRPFLNTVTKIEQDVAERHTLKTLLKLADAFGVSLDELVGRPFEEGGK